MLCYEAICYANHVSMPTEEIGIQGAFSRDTWAGFFPANATEDISSPSGLASVYGAQLERGIVKKGTGTICKGV